MFNPKTLLAQCICGLALLAHGAADAAPTYHVSIDTSGFSGQGLMDFTFLANAGATPVDAVLTNFSGAYGATFDRSPATTGGFPGGIVLGNLNGGNYLTQYVNLGGLFSFDISFDGAFAETENIDASQFDATLYNDDFTAYVGAAGSFAEFVLLPRLNGTPGTVLASSPNGMGRVAAAADLPEPPAPLLALTALAMLGFVRGRRRH
ncbi:NF038129 family PEP-CTERM protein [Massilia sp. CT11-108]|uniref:NF038129 family PEP-CTERM protein n=1 Tax=Massilia sp. CT11-108 TaxID=3393900 RepID=UPI0039A4D4AF